MDVSTPIFSNASIIPLSIGSDMLYSISSRYINVIYLKEFEEIFQKLSCMHHSYVLDLY